MRSSIFLLLFLIAYHASAQPMPLIRLTGKIIDENNIPMAFVNLSVAPDKSLGTYSNSSGEFDFQLPTSFAKDSIVFSNIGYESAVFSIHDLLTKNGQIPVVLKQKIYILEEIVIQSDSALAIVRKSIKQLPATLARDKNILQGFFREVIRSQYSYDRLVEAAIDVFDNGYNSNEEHDLQFKVREIRKSDDFRDMDWEQSIFNYIKPKNGLHGHFESLFYNDYIRRNQSYYNILTSAPLSEEYFESVIFTLDSVTQIKSDEVWCINIHPKNEEHQIYPSGTIYIRVKDYAILQIESVAMTHSDDLDIKMCVPNTNYVHKTVIKYTEYQGKMYLSLLHRKAFRFDVNLTKALKADASGKIDGHFYSELLFITNEIITEKDKIQPFRRKEKQREKNSLYATDWKYNESFWNTYNSVNERPLLPNIKKDLERESSLNDQYKKNSSDK